MTESYITVAIGDKYEQMAENLRETLIKSGDNRPLYIVKEKDLNKEDEMFQTCSTEFEKFGTFPKITLHRYMKTDRVIFLDADVLCASDTQPVWDLFNKRNRATDCLGSHNCGYEPKFCEFFNKKFSKKLHFNHNGIIYYNRDRFTKKYSELIHDIWMNTRKYTGGNHPIYKNGRGDQLIYSIAKSLNQNKPLNLIDHPIMTFCTHGDYDYPRHVTNWPRDKSDKIFNTHIPFYHMFCKVNTKPYKTIYNTICNK